ncbi:(2Fe-2S) ferredoxin domain-containing protein [Capilliphycus salinus ALCB114379]|uniref:(2Fe-2S) ferredoxin domain-containing protein n=1 Tax=Capilliphycus salinus TaxID=2768948 RepID=UPI0039A4CC4D
MARLSSKKVLVCQNRTCRKQGSVQVLAAFKAESILDVTIEATGCLGQCGNGPMVIILPEEIWYDRVQPDEVPTIIEYHLYGGEPVKALLYAKFAQRN